MPRPAIAENVFRAIADTTRRDLLDLLRNGPSPVGALADRFALTLPAISQHLKILRDADLVREQRQGRQRVYRLHPRPLRQVVDWIAEYQRYWEDKLGALEQYLDRNHPQKSPAVKKKAKKRAPTKTTRKRSKS